MHRNLPSRKGSVIVVAISVALATQVAAVAAPAQQPTAPAAPASATGAIRGTVYDSLARAPLAGATVQAVLRDARAVAHTVTTDSAGTFRFDSLAPGTYLVGFLHPLLDLLDVEVTPRQVTVAPGAPATAALAVPTVSTMRAALCGAPSSASDSTGILVGTVRDAEQGAAVPNATVVLTWNELVLDQHGMRTERRRVPVTVHPSGSYMVCGVPTDGLLIASAQAPGRQSGLVEVELGPSRFLVRDFLLGDSAAAIPVAAGAPAADTSGATAPQPGKTPPLPHPVRRGRAQLVGAVRDPKGRAVRGAHVQVWGTGQTSITGDDGRFVLDSLPAGTYTAEARAIGFAPRRVAVDLTSRHPTSVQFAMTKPVAALERVTVLGKRSAASRWEDEFLQRRRAGWGTFFTAADVDRQHPIFTTDMLRLAAGVHVYPGPRGGSAVRLRANCTPIVVLDGTPVYQGADDIDQLVPPEQLAGVEVYTGVGGIPVQYAGGMANGCGAVLLWTKH